MRKDDPGQQADAELPRRVNSPWETPARDDRSRTPGTPVVEARPAAAEEPPPSRSSKFRRVLAPILSMFAGYFVSRAPHDIEETKFPTSKLQTLPSRSTLEHDGQNRAEHLPWTSIAPTDGEVLQMQSAADLKPGRYLVVQVVAADSVVHGTSGGTMEMFYRPLESAVAIAHNADTYGADSFSVDGLQGRVQRQGSGFTFYILTPAALGVAANLPEPIIEFLNSLVKDVIVTVFADGLIDATKKTLGKRHGDSTRTISGAPTALAQPTVQNINITYIVVQEARQSTVAKDRADA